MVEFDEKDYRKQIADLRWEVQARLAYRNALRCLPLLAVDSTFEYWKAEDRPCHLAAVLWALDVAATTTTATTTVTAAADDAFAAAAADGAFAAAFAVSAAAFAVSAASAAATSDVFVSAASTAATAANVLRAFQRHPTTTTVWPSRVALAITNDLSIARRGGVAALWCATLWPADGLKEYEQLWQRFAKIAEALHPASRYWLEWHAARWQGLAPSKTDMQRLWQRIEVPEERLQ